MNPVSHTKNWLETLGAFKHPRVLTMLFFGISAGLPILLIFSSLSLWLREAGVERAAVTYFSWAALGYSFKFVWAPLIDKLPLPFLTKWLGRRRAWLLFSQLMIIVSITAMAFINPADDMLVAMAWAAVLLGFSSATQDIALDAYRIESAEVELQALMSSTYIVGYRIAMIVAGAGALFLASYFGSVDGHYQYEAWQKTYLIMASFMSIGVITTLIISEPVVQKLDEQTYSAAHYLRFLLLFALSVTAFVVSFFFSSDIAQIAKSSLNEWLHNANLAGFIVELCRLGCALVFAALVAKLAVLSGLVDKRMVRQAYVAPVTDFFKRYGGSLALLLLALIGLYRISDIVLGVMSNVFYYDLGFSKNEIATGVKAFGVVMSILGALFGGVLTLRYGVMRILLVGAVLSSATNLLFMLLAQVGYDIPLLYVVVAADNFSAGLASAAFIAFLSSLTNVSFTAMQYAIFSSLMTLFPKILGGYSGGMVNALGYETFFLFTALMGVPVMLLIMWAGKRFELNELKVKS